MYETIKAAFENLTVIPEFQMLVRDYRVRFGIPKRGFSDSSSEEYRNWIKEGLRKSDRLKDQFIFIAKRCRNLIPDSDSVPNVILAYYFLFGIAPNKSSQQNSYNFSVNPSGILGSFDITFTVPILFGIDDFLSETEKHLDEIKVASEHAKEAVQKLSDSSSNHSSTLGETTDLLPTTPGNGSDIIDRVHRDMGYLTEFGRIVLREHLLKMKDEDFVIAKYEDKNKPIFAPVQQMGMFLLNRGLYPIAEEYWKHIDDEIQKFNTQSGRRVNRGIPLANAGVSQISQGKVVEGLFNIYRGYNDDKECLAHLSEIVIDPEKDMAKSILFTQFEERQISNLFNLVVSKFPSVFPFPMTKEDLSNFVLNLNSDKKLLFYITLYRFSFGWTLNNQLTTIISRSELVRSLSELALWFEDELKRKDTTFVGNTLIPILDQKIGQINPTRGLFTNTTSLNDLSVKISNIISASSSIEMKNARILGCMRNFAGHNMDLQGHAIFQRFDEIFARMLAFVIYSKTQSWI